MPHTPTLQDVLQAIVASREALEVKNNMLGIDLGILRVDHRRISERVTATEREISETIPTVAAVGGRMDSVESRLHALENRAEDAKNRARRNNIRVVGLPGKVDGSNIVRYLEEWIKKEGDPPARPSSLNLTSGTEGAACLLAALPPQIVRD
ncbi:hypothetical protein NDU88_007061 [Pleurodeles waltl]|uniref:Uncharacterized protein n=1 Tax=Pleurodeles waltl TaxID=8319 RepID=A0AAV7PKJ2_PLEWA|nr:hypothetical protein NDU88_007061 [Pleurodeles waltl]